MIQIYRSNNNYLHVTEINCEFCKLKKFNYGFVMWMLRTSLCMHMHINSLLYLNKMLTFCYLPVAVCGLAENLFVKLLIIRSSSSLSYLRICEHRCAPNQWSVCWFAFFFSLFFNRLWRFPLPRLESTDMPSVTLLVLISSLPRSLRILFPLPTIVMYEPL